MDSDGSFVHQFEVIVGNSERSATEYEDSSSVRHLFRLLREPPVIPLTDDDRARLRETILADLTPEQQEIVQTTHGAIYVAAGAGCGKTKVLAHRAAYALVEEVCPPSQMLAVTFTNKASREMRDRVTGLIDGYATEMTICTIHALCLRILRAEHASIELNPHFVVYDEQDSLALIESACDGSVSGDARRMLDFYNTIAGYKADGLYPQNQSAMLEIADGDRDNYRRYQNALERNNALDFADLIGYTCLLFEHDGEVLSRWQQQFHWIEVDEFQDTAVPEYFILSRLATAHGNICCFGDPNQAIYGWRGAVTDVITEQFRVNFAGARMMSLNTNWRSTQIILSAASAVASPDAESPQTLIARPSAPIGERVAVMRTSTPELEVEAIAEKIATDIALGKLRYRDFAILARRQDSLELFAKVLRDWQIPVTHFSRVSGFQGPEVKDALSYLRVVANEFDATALRRIADRPPRELKSHRLASLEIATRRSGLLITDFVNSRALAAGDPFAEELQVWRHGNVVVFDLETTSTDPGEAEIVEIAATRLEAGAEVEHFHVYCRSSNSVGASASVHHLSDEFLSENGLPIEMALIDFLDFIGSAWVAGHNVAYDLAVLNDSLQRLGRPPLVARCIDTLPLARRFLSLPRYRLAHVARALGVGHAPTHRADQDVRVTVEVLGKLMVKLAGTEMERTRVINGQVERFGGLAALVESWRNCLKTEPLPVLVERILDESGYMAWCMGEAGEEAPAAIRLRELQRLIAARDDGRPALETVGEFLQFAAMARSIDNMTTTGDAVSLLTIHAAKGLEFPIVYLTGAREGNMPSWLSITESDGRDSDEERRVFYVGMTRARDQLIISYHKADGNGKYHEPSRYLSDIPADLCQMVDSGS
ncbi:MAG TPA: UvrD-helicase domain-containing protein [Chloroflexota bacterium]|nr:UvrD-helicase domain-containing protein [Chloroflexota bacterium]